MNDEKVNVDIDYHPFRSMTKWELLVNGTCAAGYLVILFAFVGCAAVKWLVVGDNDPPRKGYF